MTQERADRLPDHGAWFGPKSFVSAGLALSLNIIPALIIAYLFFILAVASVIECAVAAVLCAAGGRVRQIGTGIAVALFGTAACYLLIPTLFNGS